MSGVDTPFQNWLFIPGLQQNSRGERRILLSVSLILRNVSLILRNVSFTEKAVQVARTYMCLRDIHCECPYKLYEEPHWITDCKGWDSGFAILCL
jgi:hypothetical protein